MPRGPSDSSAQLSTKIKKTGTTKGALKSKAIESAKKAAVKKLEKSPKKLVKTISTKRNISPTKSKKVDLLKLKKKIALKKIKKKDITKEKLKVKNDDRGTKNVKSTVKKLDKTVKLEKKTISEKNDSKKFDHPIVKRGRKRKIDETKSVNKGEETILNTKIKKEMNKKLQVSIEPPGTLKSEERLNSSKSSITNKLILEQNQNSAKRVTRTLKRDSNKSGDHVCLTNSSKLKPLKGTNDKPGARKTRLAREKDKASEEILAELAAIKAGSSTTSIESLHENKNLVSDESSNKGIVEKNTATRKTRQTLKQSEEIVPSVQKVVKLNETKLEKKPDVKVSATKESEKTGTEEKQLEPCIRNSRSLRSSLRNLKDSENEDSTDGMMPSKESTSTICEIKEFNKAKSAITEIKTSIEEPEIEPNQKFKSFRTIQKTLKKFKKEDSIEGLSISRESATVLQEKTILNETELAELPAVKVSVIREAENSSGKQKQKLNLQKIKSLRNFKESENEDSSDIISASEFSENDSPSTFEIKRESLRSKQVLKPSEDLENDVNVVKNETHKVEKHKTTESSSSSNDKAEHIVYEAINLENEKTVINISSEDVRIKESSAPLDSNEASIDEKQETSKLKILSPETKLSMTVSFPSDSSGQKNSDVSSNCESDILLMNASETSTEIQCVSSSDKAENNLKLINCNVSFNSACSKLEQDVSDTECAREIPPIEAEIATRLEECNVSLDPNDDTNEENSSNTPTMMECKTSVSSDTKINLHLENCVSISAEHIDDALKKAISETPIEMQCETAICASEKENRLSQKNCDTSLELMNDTSKSDNSKTQIEVKRESDSRFLEDSNSFNPEDSDSSDNHACKQDKLTCKEAKNNCGNGFTKIITIEDSKQKSNDIYSEHAIEEKLSSNKEYDKSFSEMNLDGNVNDNPENKFLLPNNSAINIDDEHNSAIVSILNKNSSVPNDKKMCDIKKQEKICSSLQKDVQQKQDPQSEGFQIKKSPCIESSKINENVQPTLCTEMTNSCTEDKVDNVSIPVSISEPQGKLSIKSLTKVIPMHYEEDNIAGMSENIDTQTSIQLTVSSFETNFISKDAKDQSETFLKLIGFNDDQSMESFDAECGDENPTVVSSFKILDKHFVKEYDLNLTCEQEVQNISCDSPDRQIIKPKIDSSDVVINDTNLPRKITAQPCFLNLSNDDLNSIGADEKLTSSEVPSLESMSDSSINKSCQSENSENYKAAEEFKNNESEENEMLFQSCDGKTAHKLSENICLGEKAEESVNESDEPKEKISHGSVDYCEKSALSCEETLKNLHFSFGKVSYQNLNLNVFESKEKNFENEDKPASFQVEVGEKLNECTNSCNQSLTDLAGKFEEKDSIKEEITLHKKCLSSVNISSLSLNNKEYSSGELMLDNKKENKNILEVNSQSCAILNEDTVMCDNLASLDENSLFDKNKERHDEGLLKESHNTLQTSKNLSAISITGKLSTLSQISRDCKLDSVGSTIEKYATVNKTSAAAEDQNVKENAVIETLANVDDKNRKILDEVSGEFVDLASFTSTVCSSETSSKPMQLLDCVNSNSIQNASNFKSLKRKLDDSDSDSSVVKNKSIKLTNASDEPKTNETIISEILKSEQSQLVLHNPNVKHAIEISNCKVFDQSNKSIALDSRNSENTSPKNTISEEKDALSIDCVQEIETSELECNLRTNESISNALGVDSGKNEPIKVNIANLPDFCEAGSSKSPCKRDVPESEDSKELKKVKSSNPPVREYLDQFVPFLLEGLLKIAYNRPEDPIQYLAEWMIFNKDEAYKRIKVAR